VTVYDMSGTPLVPTQLGGTGDPPPNQDGVTDTLWVAPRNGCDLFIDFGTDGGADNAVRYANAPVIIEVSTAEKYPAQRTYTRYAFATTPANAQEPVSFLYPDGGVNIGPDLRLMLQPSGVTHARPAAASGYVNEELGDSSWVMPYNWDHYCGLTGVSCGNPSTAFLAPIAAVPVGTSGRVFTFAEDPDVTITSGVTTTWAVPGLTLRFHENRSLVVLGNLTTQGVSFTAFSTSDPWAGVAAADGSLTMVGGEVTHATVGLTAYLGSDVTLEGDASHAGTRLKHNGVGLLVLSNTGVTLSGVGLDENETGLLADWIDDYGSGTPCFAGCRSSFTMQANPVDGGPSYVTLNDGVGINALNSEPDITDAVIWSNGDVGLRLVNSELVMFERNEITSNGGHGASSLAGANLELSPPTAHGRNRLVDNAGYELYVPVGAQASAGSGVQSGRNDIHDYRSGAFVFYHADGEELVDVMDAECNYWGVSTGLHPSRYEGAVDGSPHIAAPFAESPACNPDGFGGGPSVTEAMGDEIRAHRAELSEGASGARGVGLVRRLEALHRRDREDATGERAATFTLFASLRESLGSETMPPGRRAVAEAALEAEVSAALAGDEYDAVRSLIASWSTRVEGAGTTGRLRSVEALLAALAGDFADAAEWLNEVAAGTPDEVLAAELMAVADVYSVRAGRAPEPRVEPDETVASAHTAASGDVLMVVPNPVRGAGRVSLTLLDDAQVHMAVFDVMGRQVGVLIYGGLRAGLHLVEMSPVGLPPGVYLVRADVFGTGLARTLTTRFTVSG